MPKKPNLQLALADFKDCVENLIEEINNAVDSIELEAGPYPGPNQENDRRGAPTTNEMRTMANQIREIQVTASAVADVADDARDQLKSPQSNDIGDC